MIYDTQIRYSEIIMSENKQIFISLILFIMLLVIFINL